MAIAIAPPPGTTWPLGVFPVGLWPQGLWPDGTPFITTRTLKAAILERFQATAALTTLVPGGLWDGRPDRGVAVPYATLYTVAEPNERRNTGKGYVRRHIFQISVFGEHTDVLEDIKDAWIDTFNQKMDPLLFQNGSVISIHCVAGLLLDGDGLSPNGLPMFQQTIEMVILTNRSLP